MRRFLSAISGQLFSIGLFFVSLIPGAYGAADVHTLSLEEVAKVEKRVAVFRRRRKVATKFRRR